MKCISETWNWTQWNQVVRLMGIPFVVGQILSMSSCYHEQSRKFGNLGICQSYLMFNLLETYQIASGIHWLNPLARNRGSTNLLYSAWIRYATDSSVNPMHSFIRKSTKKLEIVFPNYTSNGNHYRCTAQNLVFTYSWHTKSSEFPTF